MNRKFLIVFAVLAAFVGFVYVWKSPTKPSQTQVATPPTLNNSEAAHQGLADKEVVDPNASPLTGMSFIEVDSESIEAAIRTGDPTQWSAKLHNLTNAHFRREDAIRVLRSFLNSSDPDVQIAAAGYLYELGSKDGKAVLLNALETAATVGNSTPERVYSAASVLHQYGESIDPDSLALAYSKFPSRDLLTLLVLEGVPEAKQLISDKLATHEPGYLGLAGILRMNDVDSIGAFKHMLSSSPLNRLDANWALYRATGDRQYFDYIAAAALEGVGLKDVSAITADLTKEHALDYLSIAGTAEAQNLLRSIASANGKTSPDNASTAIASLYYVYKDYEFVDRQILSYLRGETPVLGLNPELMWNLAAARGTPEIVAAAREKSTAAYERNFLLLKGRPVESWIILPLTVIVPAQIVRSR